MRIRCPIHRHDIFPPNRDSRTNHRLDSDDQLCPVRGLFHLSFNAFQWSVYHSYASAFYKREVGSYRRVRILRQHPDKSLHLFIRHLQKSACAVIHQKSSLDFARVDEIKGTGFVSVEKNEGVVGVGNEITDIQRSEPFGYLFPLSPSGDDDKPADMILGDHPRRIARQN